LKTLPKPFDYPQFFGDNELQFLEGSPFKEYLQANIDSQIHQFEEIVGVAPEIETIFTQ